MKSLSRFARTFIAALAILAAVAAPSLHAQSNWTYTAGGTISAGDRVCLSGANVIQAGATSEDIGVAVTSAVSTGSVEVMQYAQSDVAFYKADGAITAGADVYPGATGYVSATVSGRRIGKALNTTTTAGDRVKVVIMPTLNDRVVITKAINASSVDEWIFIADKAYTVVSVKCIFSVVGGSSCAARPRKITDTSAPGAAASSTVKEITTAAFDLTATINTTQTLTLSATGSDYVLAAGDKLALDFSGTMTGLAGGVITITLKAN